MVNSILGINNFHDSYQYPIVDLTQSANTVAKNILDGVLSTMSNITKDANNMENIKTVKNHNLAILFDQYIKDYDYNFHMLCKESNPLNKLLVNIKNEWNKIDRINPINYYDILDLDNMIIYCNVYKYDLKNKKLLPLSDKLKQIKTQQKFDL